MEEQKNRPVIDLSRDHSNFGKDTLETEAKLLAINAAFEAAKAGESGGEFALLVDLVEDWALRGKGSNEGIE